MGSLSPTAIIQTFMVVISLRNNNITAELIKLENLPLDVEAIFIKISIKREKWLLCCTYNPNKSLIENHLRQLRKQ